MAINRFIILLFASIALSTAFPQPEVEIITQPKPGQEYVFVQSSASGARPIARKDKNKDAERPFETSHKLPESLTYALNQANEEAEEKAPIKPSKPHKREANPGEGPAPAPAGAIKLDVQKLLQKYKTELKTSTTERIPKSTTTKRTSSRRTATNRNGNNKRVKKETKKEDLGVTSPRSVLTTAAPVAKVVDDDIPLVGAGSEKQRSRIQIKKGPNGQEYEYEYVYYYYDDDEDDSKDNKKVTNSHDGPARGSTTSKTQTKHRSPEANEVVPPSTRGGKTRGRQLGEEDAIAEERLPANTRFPPRSRNLNTTPLPIEEETKATTSSSRSRGRGRSTTTEAPVHENDNVSDETQGSRGRTRANVRRPSLDLVDNASFNTHSNTAGSDNGGGPTFPAELPAGPVRFLGATPNETVDLPTSPESNTKTDGDKKEPTVEVNVSISEKEEKETSPTGAPSDELTTITTGMDKVALDLYAILQGTQKLSGEDEISTEDGITGNTDETEGTTIEAVTEPLETTTTSTTTTTTTTTTPAPKTTTTTTTEAPALGRGRYRGRGSIGKKATSASSTTTEASQESKPAGGKFHRPRFGRPRPGVKTTEAAPAAEQEATKEESKPVSHSRPTLSRGRFGSPRTRTRTTAAPSEETAEHQEESHSSTAAAPLARPSLRPRPSFNPRSRGRTTTTEASSEEGAVEETASSTTQRTRRIQGGSAVRPLRPGPRINLASRGRAHSTTEAAPAPVEDQHADDSEASSSGGDEEHHEKEEAPAAPVDKSPLGRIRNRNRINVQARPKAAASDPVPVRRANPLIGRKRPGQAAAATSSEAPQEILTEISIASEEGAETEAPAEASSSSTTEEPRGLSKLLAGRRRLAGRNSAATNH